MILLLTKGEYMINKLLPERMSICYNMLSNEYTPDTTMDIYNLIFQC